MTRSVSSAWLAAARSEPKRPVFLVTVLWSTSAVEGVDKLTFASRPGMQCAASVQGISSLSSVIDPLTRDLTFPTPSIELRRDPAVRAMVENHRLRNKWVIIKLGFVGLAQSDFLQLATLRIVDVIPSEHTVTLRCARLLSQLEEQKTRQEFTNKHPNYIIKALIQTYGYPSTKIDPATFAYDYFPEIAHWSTSRHKDKGTDPWRPLQNQDFGEQTPRELISGLLRMINGTLVEDYDGVVRLKRYDSSASVVRAFSRRDVLEFKPVSIVEALYNSFTIRFAPSNGEQAYKVTLKDADSQTNYAAPDGKAYEAPYVWDCDWMNGVGVMEDPQTVPSGYTAGFYDSSTNFRVTLASVNGFAGARFDPNDLTQPSSATLSSSRVAYLMLTGDHVRIEANRSSFTYPTKPEIIRCNQAEHETPSTSLLSDTVLGPDYLYPTIGGFPTYPRLIRYHLDSSAPNGGRCQFETSPTIPKKWQTGPALGSTSDNDPRPIDLRFNTLVCDVTPAIDWMTSAMKRSSNGLADVEVRVGIEHAEVEEGDFVTFTDDVYLEYGYDGADGSITWEVVSAEPRVIDDSPGWTMKLRRVRTTDRTPLIVSTSSGWIPPNMVAIDDRIVKRNGDPVVQRDGSDIIRGT